MNEELIELIADFFHENWSHWMKYMFEVAVNVAEDSESLAWMNRTGLVAYTFNEDMYDRWQRQMKTPYSELSEKEKDSDREWAEKLLKLLSEKIGRAHV